VVLELHLHQVSKSKNQPKIPSNPPVAQLGIIMVY
jgi:hypothetical protein